MDTNEIKFVLEGLRFSADMPPEVLEQLAAASTTRQVPAGTIIFREGGENENLYLVCSGRLALEMNVPGRGAVRILTIGPGEMSGWSALLGRGKMTATSLAVEDTDLVVAPAQNLQKLFESDHDFGFHLMQEMATALAKRLIATRLQLLDLFADTPPTISAGTAEGNG